MQYVYGLVSGVRGGREVPKNNETSPLARSRSRSEIQSPNTCRRTASISENVSPLIVFGTLPLPGFFGVDIQIRVAFLSDVG